MDWGMVVFLVALYFLPSIVARHRQQNGCVNSIGPTVVVNTFFGWTFVGWVVALAMAVR